MFGMTKNDKRKTPLLFLLPNMSETSKRGSYPANFKLKVIQFAKEHGNKAAARLFGPPPTSAMIRRWRKEEEELSKLPRIKRAARGKSAT